MSVGSTVYSATGDNAVNAAAGWQIAEFNVFGAGGSSVGGGAATFNAGAAMNAAHPHPLWRHGRPELRGAGIHG